MIIDLNVTKFYQSNYRPIVFTVDAPQLFDATLVMATLAEQRRDDIQSKDDSNILNASESDVHISTQQSMNEVDRLGPNLKNIVQATSNSSLKERNSIAFAQKIRDSYFLGRKMSHFLLRSY